MWNSEETFLISGGGGMLGGSLETSIGLVLSLSLFSLNLSSMYI